MQEKLKSHATFSKGKGYKKNDLVPCGYPVILYGELYTNYREFITEVNTFVKDETNSVKSLGQEVIVPSSGESPEDIARASSVKVKDIILGGDLNIIYPNKDISPDFLALTLSNGKAKRELTSKAQGSSITHLYNADIEKLDISFPSLGEQSKIIDMIRNINKIITLEQEKIKKLEKALDFILRNILARSSEKTPNIRFKLYENNWHTVKLKNISQISTGNKNTQDAISDGEYPFYIRSEDIMRSNEYSFDEEAILVPGEGRLGEIYHYINGKYALHQRVYRIGSFTGNVVGEFVYWNMRIYFKRHILRNTSSTTAPSIRKPALENYELRIPPSKEEQIDIINLLKYIDESLISSKDTIKKLNKFKEYLLINMFV